MARLFDITVTSDSLKLTDTSKPCETTITVSNASQSPRRCRAVVRASDPAKAEWFPIKAEPERTLKPGETTQFTVEVKLPPGTTQGKYQFRLDAIDAENPDELVTEGPAVGLDLTIPIIKPPPPPFPWWILAVAAIVLIGAGAGVWLLLGKGVVAPDLVGMKYDEAISTLKGKKLKIEEEMQVGDAPENSVVSQTPEQGTKLKKGDTVKIVYEAPFVEVPALEGLDETDAIAAVKTKKLTLRKLSEVRQNPNKAGKVLSQSTKAGTKARQGDELDIEVEAAMVRIPDLTTKKAKDAMEELDRVGLKYEIKTVAQDASKSGTILSQRPESPAIVQRGEVIHLTAEKGRIQVPSVAQLSQQAAEKLVRDAKLKPVMVPPQLFPDAVRVGDIGASVPPRDTPLVEGDEVKLIPAGKPVTVPEVTSSHMTEADATEALRRAGLTASVSRRYVAPTKSGSQKIPPPNLGRVVEQSPPTGSTLVENSAVTIYVVTDRPQLIHTRFDTGAIRREFITK